MSRLVRDLKKAVSAITEKIGVDQANVRLCARCQCANCAVSKRMTSGEKRARLAELIGKARGLHSAANHDVMRGELEGMLALGRTEFETQVRALGYRIEVVDEEAVAAAAAKWKADNPAEPGDEEYEEYEEQEEPS
jgi:hypothetical protein